MKELLKAEDIKACITAHIIRNPLWQDKDVNIFYIVNQMAGCFTKKSKSDIINTVIFNCKTITEYDKRFIKKVSTSRK